MTATSERLDLAPDPRSVRAARAFVERVLRDWGLHDCVDTAVLLTSELATNAVRHASSRFAVVVTRTRSGAQVDVLDRADGAPAPRGHDLDADSGRGLQLVDALAPGWGSTPAADLRGYVKGVRFDVSEPAAAGGTSTREQGAPAAGR